MTRKAEAKRSPYEHASVAFAEVDSSRIEVAALIEGQQDDVESQNCRANAIMRELECWRHSVLSLAADTTQRLSRC